MDRIELVSFCSNCVGLLCDLFFAPIPDNEACCEAIVLPSLTSLVAGLVAFAPSLLLRGSEFVQYVIGWLVMFDDTACFALTEFCCLGQLLQHTIHMPSLCACVPSERSSQFEL